MLIQHRFSLKKIHRVLGLGIGPLMMMWFLTGSVMIFAGMPRSLPEGKLGFLPPIEAAKVHVGFSEAYSAAGLKGELQKADLEMFLDRPVYRLRNADGESRVVYADTADILSSVDQQMGKQLVGLLHRGSIRDQTVLTEPDQWTVGRHSHANVFPLYRYVLNDDSGTWVYLSKITGEIIHISTKKQRMLAWLGAIPHWLYFTPLRKHRELWRRTIIGLSLVCLILPISGIILWRRARRPDGCGRGSYLRHSIYRGRRFVHMMLGLAWGIPIGTFTLSGMLSLSFGGWPESSRLIDEFPRDLTPGIYNVNQENVVQKLLSSAGHDLRRMELRRLGDTFLIVGTESSINGWTAVNSRVKGWEKKQISTEETLASFPLSEKIGRWNLLSQPDFYLSPFSNRYSFPLLRVEMNDRQHTWIYINPAKGQIAVSCTKAQRVNRWLYRFLHRLDLPWLVRFHPVRELILLVFMAGGLSVCMTGFLSWQNNRNK